MAATRADCVALDAADPLARHRDAFLLPGGVIYLDGNSLGALPKATPQRLREVIENEWGQGLIGSWNAAGWIEAPRRVGAKIARLIGAFDDEVICADSTSVNLFKALAAALRLQCRRDPRRDTLVSEGDNFPTDLYIAQSIASLLGLRLVTVAAAEIEAALDDRSALLLLTQVNYRKGRMHDLLRLTQAAQRAGALMLWDLAHSAGAVPVDLNAAGADFAVGCGYKYLNGGPGAPAFVFAARRHLAAMAGDRYAQPLAGWLGHRAPFAFLPQYEPAAGIDRFGAGTPSILALAALECGVDTVLAAGIEALRAKSMKMTNLFIELVERRCSGFELELVSPRDAVMRGSQVGFAHQHAWPIMQALIARGVVGDFRASADGDDHLLRFGFAPLYLRYADLWDAVEILREILATRAWDQPQFTALKTVT